MKKIFDKIKKAQELNMEIDESLSLQELAKQATEFLKEHNSYGNTINIEKKTTITISIKNNKHKLTKEDFIKKAREVHRDKYNYDKVEYKNNFTKVCIICPEHGEFYQTPAVHLRGCGCPKCSIHYRNSDDFIKQARKVHGQKYDYSKVEYVNSKTPVTIICPEHGEFMQNPDNHLHGSGCPKCGGTSKMNKTDFIRKSLKVHGDKYNYHMVKYVNNHTPVRIVCPEHGEFEVTPANHLNGYGCPECKFVYVVYAYKFDDYKAIYIGITNNVKRRDTEHMSSEKDSVRQFCYSHNTNMPLITILESNVSVLNVRERESYYIGLYKNQGYEIINKERTAGSLNMHNYWTENAIRHLIKDNGIKSRSRLKSISSGAYEAARRLGILDSIFEDVPKIWTRELCIEYAGKCKTKYYFAKKYPSAYAIARKLGILGDIFGDKPKKWNYESCYNAALKCQSLKEFYTNYPGAYNIARAHGWIGDYAWFTKNI